MKKLFNLALFGAIALTGAVGFSSCSSSSDEVIDNPDYNPETNSVKTQFTISIPTSGGQATTRMDGNGAPNDGVFKGMKDIKLYPINSAQVDVNSKATATSAISVPIGLTAISAFDQKGVGDNSFNGKVYSDVDIPIGTKAFLFYGEITDEKGGDLTPSYGPISPATSGTTAEINFGLVPIQTATFSTLSDAKGTAVLTALNGIIAELVAQEAAAVSATHASATHLNSVLQSFQSLKAGSANSVKAFVQNVYNQLTEIGTTYSANTYTNAVQDKIDDYFTVGGTSPNNTLTWATENTFPNNIGLPDGAIGVNCSTTNVFSFANASVGGNDQPELNTYVKPASLFYTVNTPIHTSTEAQVAKYSTKSTWAEVVALYSATEVQSNTRAVVLDYPIQYGVGRMASTVVLTNTSLKANTATGVGESDVDATAGYTVTGILIGNQKNVGWDFTPVSTSSTYTIYDPVQTGSNVIATATATDVNYTLALQTAKDEPVRVVVEMTNNGAAFYGIESKLIPSGSKFYLVAQLDPKATTGVTGYDETKDAKNRVFCQDVETIVNFTVGTNSLKKAYNTIPDLRSAKMELGLSVDLTWQSGLQFDVTFQ